MIISKISHYQYLVAAVYFLIRSLEYSNFEGGMSKNPIYHYVSNMCGYYQIKATSEPRMFKSR